MPGVPRRPRPQKRSAKSSALGTLLKWSAAIIIGAAVGALAVWATRDVDWEAVFEDDWRPRVYVPIRAPRVPKLVESKPSKVVYLNREGALLHAGLDNASKNRSALVEHAGRRTVRVPAFAGSKKAWDAMVACLRKRFTPFDVTIVDQRPIAPGYIMTVVGGTPKDVHVKGHDHGGKSHSSHLTGLAPFNSSPIENAVVLVFSRTLRERSTPVCETGAMEIAHAYGLDHTRDCRDLMTYKRPCGTRRFLDANVPCGEDKDRTCADGKPTQNSYRRLLKVLGARTGG